MTDNTCLFTLNENVKGAVWEVTYRCGYGCLHCCNKSADSDILKKYELSTNQIKSGIDQLTDFGINSIYWSGGDPLNRSDFLELLSYSRTRLKNRNLFFATNGHKLTHEMADEIGKIDVGSVLVSLDGHTPDVAEKFRPVKNNYHIALNAVNMLGEKGVSVTIGSVLWRETYDHIEDLIKIGIDNGADTMFFSWLVPLGSAAEHKEIFVPQQLYDSVGNQLHDLRNKYAGKINVRFRRFETITEDSETCPGGVKNYHLVPDGRISVCSWAYKSDPTIISKDSIKDKPLVEIINDEAISRFLQMVKKRGELGLGPGCPALCKIHNDDYLTKDPLFKSKRGKNGKEK